SALHEVIGAPLPPVWQEDFEQRLESVRETMSAEAFGAAWAAGRTLTLDQAVDFALAAVQPALFAGGPERPAAAEQPIPVSAQDPILDEIEEFLTGVRPAADPDRVLATVLAMEIV